MTVTPGVHERTAAAMGTSARVVVVGGAPHLADAALARIEHLEQRWSRFRADSEVSRLNSAAGMPCVVSRETFGLVQALVSAWRVTGGRFDPTVHDAVVALGYDRALPDAPVAASGDTAAAPGCGGVRLDRATRMVWLPRGVRLDPGGLGKGLAADLIAARVMRAGAAGVLVDLGGDLRVMGDSPDGSTWRIAIEHPGVPGRELARVETRNGAVATSSRGRRRWELADGTPVHHVLDPRTGRPVATPWVSASAIAPSAADAEVAATVAFIDGDLAWAPRAFGALLAAADGSTRVLGSHPERFALAMGAAA